MGREMVRRRCSNAVGLPFPPPRGGSFFFVLIELYPGLLWANAQAILEGAERAIFLGAAVLARNKARVLIEQDYVLSIYLSKHNILSTYDGDYICWHVMFGHRIESL